jgi:Glycosyltransferase
VKLAGWREDIPRLLDACDVFVLTSLNEGLGLVLVEAMAKKLPVIATAVGGVPEVVDDGVTGVLLPAGDVGSIAKAIQDLAADPELRAVMGGAGYARAHELFSINQTVRNTEAIYRELLPQP